MSDEWYVLAGSKVRGPATAAQLRKALADGKIQPETPVRAGNKGAWTFVREIPELGPVPETPSPGVKDSVMPGSPDFTQVDAAPQPPPRRRQPLARAGEHRFHAGFSPARTLQPTGSR